MMQCFKVFFVSYGVCQYALSSILLDMQGIVRPILRSKLLEKVDAYVDLQADIYIKTIKTKHGEGQP